MTTNNAFNTYIVPTTANEVTRPLQPAFSAFLSGSDANSTGAGAVYTVGGTSVLTEIFDQNADLAAGTGIFTAPVTGCYQFEAHVRAGGPIGSSTDGRLTIVTSNRTYVHSAQNIVALQSTGVGWDKNIKPFADMDAADTATFTITATAEGGNTISVVGGGTWTMFTGALIC